MAGLRFVNWIVFCRFSNMVYLVFIRACNLDHNMAEAQLQARRCERG